jgi:hypothetical protein
MCYPTEKHGYDKTPRNVTEHDKIRIYTRHSSGRASYANGHNEDRVLIAVNILSPICEGRNRAAEHQAGN